MNIPPETERAWAAGFFDGEGNLRYNNQEGYGSLRLQVAQNDTMVLERLQVALGGFGNIYGPYQYGPQQPWYNLTISKFEHVQQAVCLLWPYLSPIKCQQIHNAFVEYHCWFVARTLKPRGPKPHPQREAGIRLVNAGRTQSEVARQLGIDPSTVSRWMNMGE